MQEDNKRRLRTFLALLLGVTMLSVAAYSQGTASIVGTVTDPTGAAVPGATVTITNTDTGLVRSTTTNATGNYAAPELAIGKYNVKVVAPGFKAYERTGITLNVNDTVRTDAPLQVGETRDSVTVEANAIQVQSESSEVSQTVTAAQVADLATNGRNVIQLAALVPGAAASIPDFDTPMAQTQGRNISFNGQRSDHNNWLINGGEAYDRGGGGIMLVSPSQDALQEFKVMTSNFAADLGQSSGGMITMATKAGTRQFHGGLWEYLRNDKLDANTFIAKASGKNTKPELRYNTFGFNVGGPVPIQKEPKTFFFYNMEWRRLVNGGEINAVAVPRAMTTGDFSSVAALKVPATSDPAYIAKLASFGLTPGGTFPNNQIPTGLLSPAAQAVLKAGLFPGPNTTAGRYYKVNNKVTNYREETARLDHQIGSKLNLMASLIYDNGVEHDIPPLWAGGTYDTAGSIMSVPSWTGVVHATYTISPTLLNEAAFNLNGNNLDISATGLYQKPSGYNVKNFFSANKDNKLPGVSLGSPYNISYTPGWWPWTNTWRSWQWKDDISWVHGRHNMKFGAAYMYTHKWQQYQLNAGGQFTFNGGATGNSFADFMLGFANGGSNGYSEPANVDFVNISNNTYSLYALDDWRVSNRLTVNLGLRWEGLPHAYDSKDATANFYPKLYDPKQAPIFLSNGALDTNGPGFTTVSGIILSNMKFYLNGMGLAGRNGIPRGLVDNHWNTFAPRVGFAYDLTGRQKTILRAGAGIFYERLAGNEMYNLGQNIVPFSYQSAPNNVYFDNPNTSYLNGQAAAAPYYPANVQALDPTYKIPTAVQWSLGIQQQLRENAVLTVTYVGNSNYHQSQGRNINSLAENDTQHRLAVCGANCGYTGTQVNANLFRPYLGWGTIAPMEMAANSNYNSLQVAVRATAWKNLTFNTSYTWSHAFDIIDGEIFSNINNPFNARWDYGPAGYDRRHISVSSFIYQLPLFNNSAKAVKALAGGWELSGILTLESGTPTSIGAGPDILGLGGATGNRANIVAPINYLKTREQWFDKASFQKPGALQWGTSSRNNVVTPGRNNWNMALFKAFQFAERARFEFRLETFNTFNHTQLNGLSTNVTATDFGQLNGAFAPRILQLGAKLLF